MKKQVRSSSKNKLPEGIGIAALVFFVLAAAGFTIVSRANAPAEHNAAQETAGPASTLKDMYGTEFTPDDIMAKFNAFMQETNADQYSIKELALEQGATQDVYRGAGNNDDTAIFMTTRAGRQTVTSISVSARRGDGEPTAFITYCSALMDIFTPTMHAVIRQRVIHDMMGYEEGSGEPLAAENTFIIAETKYMFTSSTEKLNLLIEQMPELEEASADELPPTEQ